MAEVSGVDAKIDRVVFRGDNGFVNSEGTAPYTLYANVKNDYNGIQYNDGSHFVSAEVYTAGSSSPILTKTISFNINANGSNASENVTLQNIKDNSNLSGNVVVSASTSIKPNFIEFYIDGQNVWTESSSPFYLGGDNKGNPNGYNVDSLSSGKHTIQAVAVLNDQTFSSNAISFNINNSGTPIGVIPTPVPPTASTPLPVDFKPPRVAGDVVPIPEFAKWESNMTKFADIHCNTLSSASTSLTAKLGGIYYDAAYSYYRIGDYTKDSKWYNCGKVANQIYKDQYVTPNNGKTSGYWNFTYGLLNTYLRFGDESSKLAALSVNTNAAYSRDWTKDYETIPAELARETSYAIMSHINSEILGQPRSPRLRMLVDHSIGYVDQWFISKTAKYVRPFMVGISGNALIAYYENVEKDPKIIEALKTSMDKLWDATWVDSAQAFKYNDRVMTAANTDPAVDLNLIIAPVFAWLYHQTGDVKYLDRGDAIFASGVKKSYLTNIKQFNQNYRWSFDYITYRGQKPLK